MRPGVPLPLLSPTKPSFTRNIFGKTLNTEQDEVLLFYTLFMEVKPSAISTALLQSLLTFHTPPIKLVVSQWPYSLAGWVISS